MIGPATRSTAVLPHVLSRIGLRFAGGVYSLFVVRLIGSLTGHEAVNGYACDSRPSDSKPAAPEKSSFPAAATEPAPATQPAVVYTCPMHPEVVSDKPGTCPKCGMDLVLKK